MQTSRMVRVVVVGFLISMWAGQALATYQEYTDKAPWIDTVDNVYEEMGLNGVTNEFEGSYVVHQPIQLLHTEVCLMFERDASVARNSAFENYFGGKSEGGYVVVSDAGMTIGWLIYSLLGLVLLRKWMS